MKKLVALTLLLLAFLISNALWAGSFTPTPTSGGSCDLGSCGRIVCFDPK